ncbi:acyl transferase, partial [Chryseobacterium sp. SIMBA_038]
MELKSIFNIQTEQDFLNASLKTFRYQYENVEVYRKFVDYLNINPDEVKSLDKIPFLPIEMFKNHQILDQNVTADLFFQSSGT